MKIIPKIYTANRKIAGAELHRLGYTHLNRRYDYRIAVLPGHPDQKLLLTYHYSGLEDRYDLSVVDRSLNRLSHSLLCLGPYTQLYAQWFPELIQEALQNQENR